MRIGVSATFMMSARDARNAGISRYCREIVGALARIAPHDQFDIFLTSDCEPPEDWAHLPNLKVLPEAPGGRVARTLWDRSAPNRYGRERKLDAWFATSHALVPKRTVVPTLTMVHDFIPWVQPGSHVGAQLHFLRYALVAATRNSDLVMVNSEVTKGDAVRIARADADKIVVAPLGPGNAVVPVSPDSVSDERLRELGVRGKDYFLTLGTLEPRKNLPRLFEAMAGIPVPWRLAVAGGKGWADSPIFARVQELGIQDRIDFLGYVPDEAIAPLMARARAFVYPSMYEGYGIPALEGMLAGAPVLTSAGTSMVEICGDTAEYFDPLSVESIAGRLTAAIAPEWDRATRVDAGFRRAPSFTWERCAELTYAAMRRLVEARG